MTPSISLNRRYWLATTILLLATLWSDGEAFAADWNAAPTFDAGAIAYFAGVGEVGTTVVQPDGKILIGGFISSVGGVPRNSLARLNADGTLDTSFNPPASSRARWPTHLRSTG